MNYTIEALIQICKEADLHIQITPTGLIEVTSVEIDIELSVELEDLPKAISALETVVKFKTM